MSKDGAMEIRRLKTLEEAEICARMMSGSEPWITLKRDYDASLRIVQDPEREVYVATSSNEIVEFIILIMEGALVGYIQSVCCASGWRGRGIGSQLMDFAERRILNEAPNVFITVSSFNDGAPRLYERLGYEVVVELKNLIVLGHSEILMRKTTSSMADFNEL